MGDVREENLGTPAPDGYETVTVFMPIREATMFKKMPYNEPRFTLRGQDLFAPIVVKLWALLCRLVGIATEKVNGAEATANDMTRWQTRKLPD